MLWLFQSQYLGQGNTMGEYEGGIKHDLSHLDGVYPVFGLVEQKQLYPRQNKL